MLYASPSPVAATGTLYPYGISEARSSVSRILRLDDNTYTIRGPKIVSIGLPGRRFFQTRRTNDVDGRRASQLQTAGQKYVHVPGRPTLVHGGSGTFHGAAALTGEIVTTQSRTARNVRPTRRDEPIRARRDCTAVLYSAAGGGWGWYFERRTVINFRKGKLAEISNSGTTVARLRYVLSPT